MAYLENMKLLKDSFPDAWKKMSEIEGQLDKDLVRSVPSKKGSTTLLVGQMFLHNENNPIQEAKEIIENHKNTEDHSDILFYGIGLGYHIKAFIKQYPNASFDIYEPVPEVFHQFLCYTDLTQIPRHLIKNIYIESHAEDPLKFCSSFVRKIRNSVLIIELPAYKSIFPEKRQNFYTQFENHIRERSASVNTNSAFEKRWTINSTKNFIQVLNTPDILLDKKGSFKNKPAIIVASGPSLEEEIENLRTIKEAGLAYIFSVGTALNTLVQHEIYPDAACTYDPTEKNQVICKEVLEKAIKSIPLIFGSTVGYETLEKYPGPKMHMLISQDSLAAFYLKPGSKEGNELIHDATTIALITLQLLYKLGFSPIVLAGQNLAYRDKKVYAAGSTFHPHEANEKVLENAVMVKDVYGNQVASNHSFIRMRQQIEVYLSHHKDANVINTTKYGAHIEGTRFQNLDELMKEQLLDRFVEDNWLESGNCSYDIEYLIEQSHIMNGAYAEVNQLLERCQLNLDIISQLADSSDSIRINQSYEEFNLSMDELRKNHFFATFITPMNRVELEFLMLAVPGISAERDPILKAQMMEKEFRLYLLNCEQDINAISPVFQEMSQSIHSFYTDYIIHKKVAMTKVLLIDCDGVLTDGANYYSASGAELKKFNFKDRSGILRLHEKGIQTLLINPEADLVIENAAEKMGIRTVYSGTEDKKQIIATVLKEYALDYTEIACIFNDMSDLELFKQAGLSFAVKNASKEVQHVVDYVLTVNGGQGAIFEIAELLTADKIFV
ncbi:MAG: 6-hydroxymethylpterin diphosphokinase MptE-like protein [Bacillota bacterium]|nr:6-hydroxymethylpterin diphosphokinase MptE-like protein [Bacillota bacterium]